MFHFILFVCLLAKSNAMEFAFTPFTMDMMGDMKVSPKFERLKKLEVAPINSDVKTNMKLLEFILLDMDFNYIRFVPSYKRLTFTMPDMWTGFIEQIITKIK